MAAGVSNHVWEIEEIVALLEAREQAGNQAGELKRGNYRPRASA
jgi:hypothetical protein